MLKLSLGDGIIKILVPLINSSFFISDTLPLNTISLLVGSLILLSPVNTKHKSEGQSFLNSKK
ncbi:hypothetical protein ES703_120247 [subsurface metagenome]